MACFGPVYRPIVGIRSSPAEAEAGRIFLRPAIIVIVIVIVIYYKYVEFTKNNTRVYNTKKITDNIKII